MEKKMRSTTSRPPQLEELIKEDGILSSIISSLPLREAFRTCVLSPRWRHIWTHLRDLEFDAANMFDPHTVSLLKHSHSPLTRREKAALLAQKTDEFIRSVTSFLQQRRGARIEKFCVEYYLHKAHSKHLDAWLRFAVEAKTEFLDLNLEPPWFIQLPTNTREPYDFPCHLFDGHKGSSIVSLDLTCCSLKPPHGFDGLNNLKKLLLNRVDTTEEDIRRILSNCFTLENLFLKDCRQLVTLSSPHPLNRLSDLSVIGCDQLRKIEINAKNLARLGYWGGWGEFIFGESSQLTWATFWFQNDVNVDFSLAKLLSSFPHLEHLNLNMSCVFKVLQVADLPRDSITFPHLNSLDWILGSKMSLVCLASILNVAPFLEELKLDCQRCEAEPAPGQRVLRRLPKRSHTHLKIVKIGDFYGDNWQIEIAIYLLNNATELESMTLKAGRESSEKIHEVVVEYLSREIPVNVNFLIL